MKLKMLLALIGSILMSACSGVSSDDSETENLTAQFRAISDGTNITLEAQFYNSSNGAAAITLEDGDLARVYYYRTSIPLVELNQQGLYTYSRGISSNLEGEIFRFALERSDKIGAPNSSIYLPSPFDIVSTQTGRNFLYTDPISITWDGESATDTQFNILRIYECLDAEDTAFLYHQENSFVDSDGEADLDDSGLLIDDNLVSCEVTIELGRIVSSGVDDRFKGGAALGIQKRTLNLSMVFSEQDLDPEPEPEPEV